MKADNKTEAKAAADDVVRNAKAISAAVASFYGDDARTGMLNLLSGHWGAVKDMTDASQKGDETGVQSAMDAGIANAADIAKFLTAGEAETWMAMQAHMDVIADALAAAIAKQFPDKAS